VWPQDPNDRGPVTTPDPDLDRPAHHDNHMLDGCLEAIIGLPDRLVELTMSCMSVLIGLHIGLMIVFFIVMTFIRVCAGR